MSTPAIPTEVAAVYARFPEAAREGALALRGLVFEVAATMPEVGRISEELRWGEPAYLTPETGAGMTIRIGAPKAGGYALLVNCRTTLIDEFRQVAPHLHFDGSRAVLIHEGEAPDRTALALLIRAALGWHRRRRRARP